MRVPKRLESLLHQGVIEDVLRPLMSGKEAEVYLVLADGEERVAKVYKNAQFRSFQHRAEYTEGRRVRNSRKQRAMNKGSRYGRARTEDAWYEAEVDAIQRLRAAGVRVPTPYAFIEGVLVMELVKDASGQPAPRLVDTHFSPDEAREVFHVLLHEVVKMLCAGIIHADLSDFNVLMASDGPVIIDFPQAVDPAKNRSARKLLVRDVKNLTGFLGRFEPKLRGTAYGPEIWGLYERSELEPDTQLTGRFESRSQEADVNSLLEEILALEQEARERREALGLPPPRRARRPIIREEPAPKRPGTQKQKTNGKPATSQGAHAPDGNPGDPPKKRRRRRRRKKSTNGSTTPSPQQGGQQAAPRPAPQSSGRRVVETPSNSDGGAPAPRKRRRRRRRRRSSGGGDSSGD